RRIVMALEAPDQIGGDEGIAAARGLRGDEMAKARECHARGAALVDQRRHPALDAHHVGFEAEAPGDVAIDVRMGVDHSWQPQLAAHVYHLPRRRRQLVLADARDLAVADGDIHDAVDSGRRADDVTVPQDEIVYRGCVHDRLPLPNTSSLEAARSGNQTRRIGLSGVRTRGGLSSTSTIP